jgi:hypothetical protein
MIDSAATAFTWSVAGRPMPGETVSGDVGAVHAVERRLVVAGIDGLGHGPEAAHAANEAARVIEARAGDPPDEVMARCHEALTATRGAAITLAVLDGWRRLVTWCGIGNVSAILTHVENPGTRTRESPLLAGGVVGFRLPKLPPSRCPLRPGDVLVMGTDGIDSLDLPPALLDCSTEEIAETLLAEHSRPNDDALVVVARYSPSPDEP